VSDVAGLPLLKAAHKLHDSIQQQAGNAPSTKHNSPSAGASSSQAPGSIPKHAAVAAGGSSSEAVLPGDDNDINRKLLALFEQWDKTGDGRVSLQELCQGLAKFQPVKSKQVRHSG
jgi:hypothetical protein